MDNYITTYGLNGYFKLTNVSITSETYVKYKLVPLEAPAGFWFGTFTSPYFGIFHPRNNFPTNTFRWYMGSNEGVAYEASSVNDIIDHTFEMEVGYGKLVINGTQTQQPTFSVPFTVSNFGIGSALDTQFDYKKPVKWYYFQIYNGNTLVYDLVPAYYNDTYCFYDNISQTYIMPIGNVDGYVESFSATPSKDSFARTGETITINVVSDNPWTATAPDWISLSSYSGQEGGIITATAGGNNTGSERSGSLTFTDGDKTASFVLSQGNSKTVILKNLYRNGNKVPMMYRNGELIYHMLEKLVFDVDKDNISFEDTGGSTTITITANDKWTMTKPEWITASQTSGTSAATITLSASATGTERTGDIVIACGEKTKTISVVQGQDYSKMYLTIEALEDGRIRTEGDAANSTYFSINGGEWRKSTISLNIWVSAGDEVRFKGTAGGNALFSGNTLSHNAYGNIESLEYGDDFIGKTSLKTSSAFIFLFRYCTGLINVSNLVLPAITLKNNCYQSMFDGCTSLATAPALPATTLAKSCYYGMFSYCDSLTTAPALPATTLANGCYQNMFQDCTGLAAAPELPAATLASACYSAMFYRCTSLTTAPELQATTLVDSCYNNMFYGCTSLNHVKCLATDISAFYCTSNWVKNVSSTGTFVKKAGVTWSSGASGIPSGWTVIEE